MGTAISSASYRTTGVAGFNTKKQAAIAGFANSNNNGNGIDELK